MHIIVLVLNGNDSNARVTLYGDGAHVHLVLVRVYGSQQTQHPQSLTPETR